jgi:hypothetical protein
MRLRPTFDSLGRRRGHVAFFQRLSPEDYDAGAGRFRPLMRAAGDVRGGDALLGDWTAEGAQTPARLAGSRAGRAALGRLAAAVRAEFAPAAEAAARMQAAEAEAAAAAATRTGPLSAGGDWAAAAAAAAALAAEGARAEPRGADCGSAPGTDFRAGAGPVGVHGGPVTVHSGPAGGFLRLSHCGGGSGGGGWGATAGPDVLGASSESPPPDPPGPGPSLPGSDSDDYWPTLSPFPGTGGLPGPDCSRQAAAAEGLGWWWSGAEEAGGGDGWAAGLLDSELWPRLGIVCDAEWP